MLVLQESLNLSVHKAYKKISLHVFNTSMLFLLSEGNCFRIFTQAQSLENLTPCNSGDSRKVAVLENGGAGD